MRLAIYFTLFASLITGCSFGKFPGVYRISIEQGNILTQEMVDELKPGMTKRQVKFILGTPLVKDSLNQYRWDYRYLLRIGNETLKESLVTVYFDRDNLKHIEGDLMPSWSAQDSSARATQTGEVQSPSQ